MEYREGGVQRRWGIQTFEYREGGVQRRWSTDKVEYVDV